MKDFIKPIKYGKMLNTSTNKKYIYEPDSNDRIIAPYEGVITDISDSRCNGFIQLQHYIDGKYYISEICGINSKDIFAINGMKVSQGEELSKCGNENIIYEIKDSYNEKLPIATFFVLSKNKKEENKKEENKKEENKKEKNNKEEEDNEPKKWKWDLELDKPITKVPDLFTSMLLSPLEFAKKALSSKKETKEDDENLKEEIKRIKELIR